MKEAAQQEEAAKEEQPAAAQKKAEQEAKVEAAAAEKKEADAAREASDAKKDEGTKLYKAKKFDEAIAVYTAAHELDESNIACLTNRAAAHMGKKDYAACIADCELAVDVGRRHRAPFSAIARCFERIGNAYLAENKYEDAIKAYNSSLSEHRTPKVLDRLAKAEKAKKKADAEAYFSEELGEEARAKGNEHFKAADFPAAVAQYTESIKRNPKDARTYSNRAAALMKLMAYPDAMKDCEKALEIYPTHLKTLLRQATIYTVTKKYPQAMDSYREALKIDPTNQDAANGIQKVQMAIMGQQQGGAAAGGGAKEGESPEETMQRAMQDPEVREIMTDPIMRQILQDMQDDPKCAAEHLKNPMIAQKIDRLVAAGILRLG